MSVHPSIDDTIRQFISNQHLVFVASAPLDAGGHINLSPKGLDSFRVLGPASVAYLDFTGSGVETVAHLKENGRVVIMFCAFQGPPKILRLHGRGRVIEPHDSEFAGLRNLFPSPAPGPQIDSARAIVVVDVNRISSACGYGVPLMQFEGDRSQLAAWARNKGAEGLKEYRQNKNRTSLDGLPGLG